MNGSRIFTLYLSMLVLYLVMDSQGQPFQAHQAVLRKCHRISLDLHAVVPQVIFTFTFTKKFLDTAIRVTSSSTHAAYHGSLLVNRVCTQW